MRTTDRARQRKFEEGVFIAIQRLAPLIEAARKKGACAAALRRMKVKQESQVFYLVSLEIRHGTPFEKIKEHLLTIRKEASAWPLVLFSKEEYREWRFRVLTPVVNHLFLLRIAYTVYGFLKPLLPSSLK